MRQFRRSISGQMNNESVDGLPLPTGFEERRARPILRETATDDRRSLLTVTLGFAGLEPRAPELRPLHRWLDTWRGIGDVAAGMHRQGYDLQLTAVRRAWPARDLLLEGHGARRDGRDRIRLRAGAVDRGAACGVGGAHAPERDRLNARGPPTPASRSRCSCV